MELTAGGDEVTTRPAIRVYKPGRFCTLVNTEVSGNPAGCQYLLVGRAVRDNKIELYIFPSHQCMDLIEVEYRGYKFRFRRMNWQQEFAIHYTVSRDPFRTYLSAALAEIVEPEGRVRQVVSSDAAYKVFAALPRAIVERIHKVYKGSIPLQRRWVTAGLYKAPEHSQWMRNVAKSEGQREELHDRVESAMEAKYGKQEVAEQRELERQILANSNLRGAIPKEASE